MNKPFKSQAAVIALASLQLNRPIDRYDADALLRYVEQLEESASVAEEAGCTLENVIGDIKTIGVKPIRNLIAKLDDAASLLKELNENGEISYKGEKDDLDDEIEALEKIISDFRDTAIELEDYAADLKSDFEKGERRYAVA